MGVKEEVVSFRRDRLQGRREAYVPGRIQLDPHMSSLRAYNSLRSPTSPFQLCLL